MTHPLVPQVIDLASPLAQRLGLEVVGAVFQTNQTPPVLRIDVRNPNQDTSLNDCERMSHALEAALDSTDIIPDAYVLEVSSPGISPKLTTDRDFSVFKGFAVQVLLTEPHQGKKEWIGKLTRRDQTFVYLNLKGKAVTLPRGLIQSVQLTNHPNV